MFSSEKMFIFAVSLFYIIASVKSKEYELEMQKYLITRFDDDDHTQLNQNLEDGQDNITFINAITGSGDGGISVNYFIQTKAGNNMAYMGICEKPNKNNKKKFNTFVQDIIYAGLFEGKKCTIEENTTIQLPNSFTVTSKVDEDIEGIIQLTVFFEFPDTYETTLRYDVIGTVKAK